MGFDGLTVVVLQQVRPVAVEHTGEAAGQARRADAIRQAARQGAEDFEEAYAALGCRVQCGGCEDHAEALITAERACQRLAFAPRAA